MSDSEESLNMEFGQRPLPELSQEWAMRKEAENENDQKTNLINKVTELEEENEKLREEVSHYQWHVSEYHLTLEKFSNSLPVYHEAFREFRENPECLQCTNARLLQKINALEHKIEVLESGRSTSPVLGNKTNKGNNSRKRRQQ